MRAIETSLRCHGSILQQWTVWPHTRASAETWSAQVVKQAVVDGSQG